MTKTFFATTALIGALACSAQAETIVETSRQADNAM